VRLRPQELAPEESSAHAGRPQTRLSDELAYSRGRDCQAEPAQLAGDPPVAPAPVLAREAQHEFTNLAANRWPPDSTWVRPALHHQPAVPPKQCGRCDDKRPPARSRQQTTGRGEEDSIGRRQLGPTGLTPWHGEFVPEHHDLQLLELLRAKAQRGELENTPKYHVAERPEQGQNSPRRQDRPHDSTDHNRPNRSGTELTHPARQPRGSRTREADSSDRFGKRSVSPAAGVSARSELIRLEDRR
jgi:hypothetical protein